MFILLCDNFSFETDGAIYQSYFLPSFKSILSKNFWISPGLNPIINTGL